MLDGEQVSDHQTRIEHIAPNCYSREMYKGILDGTSHGVFNGKVYVHPEAQKTDGKQTNKTLLLSERARIDTKPQLEIFADDVKCTHGATVGKLDEIAQLLHALARRGRRPHAAPADLRVRSRSGGDARAGAAEGGFGATDDGAVRLRSGRETGDGGRGWRRALRVAGAHVPPQQARSDAPRASPELASGVAKRSNMRRRAPGPARRSRALPSPVSRPPSLTDMSAPTRAPVAPLDVAAIRADFPILQTSRCGGSGWSTSTMPPRRRSRGSVIDALSHYYEAENGNIHRGVHYLSETATELYDRTRETARRFFNARHAHEIIFTRGDDRGDQPRRLVVRECVHPRPATRSSSRRWSTTRTSSRGSSSASARGAVLKVIPVTDAGELDMDGLSRAAHRAHEAGERGARLQRVRHDQSGRRHRAPGPRCGRRRAPRRRAVGAAHHRRPAGARLRLLHVLRPQDARPHRRRDPVWQGVVAGAHAALHGGGRHDRAGHLRAQHLGGKLPSKFEAGTPSIGDVVAYRHAFEYLERVGLDAIAAHEHELLAYATEQVREIPGVTPGGNSGARRRGCSPSSWTAPTRTISARFWTDSASRSVQGTIAHSR